MLRVRLDLRATQALQARLGLPGRLGRRVRLDLRGRRAILDPLGRQVPQVLLALLDRRAIQARPDLLVLLVRRVRRVRRA